MFRCACLPITLQWASDGTALLALLEPPRVEPPTIPGRGICLIDVMRASATPLLLETQFGGRIVDVALSPSGEFLGIATDDASLSGIWVLRSDGSDPQRVTTLPSTALTWAADGVILFTQGGSEILAVERQGGSAVPVWESSRGGNILALAWTGR